MSYFPSTIWLSDTIKYIIGLVDESWLRGEYNGDRPVEFLPAGGISIYVDEVLTTPNLSTNNSGDILNSNLLCNIPLMPENFGQYYSLYYDNPTFINIRVVTHSFDCFLAVLAVCCNAKFAHDGDDLAPNR